MNSITTDFFMHNTKLKYLSHYGEQTQQSVQKLIEQNKLDSYLIGKYQTSHGIKNDKQLFEYTQDPHSSHEILKPYFLGFSGVYLHYITS